MSAVLKEPRRSDRTLVLNADYSPLSTWPPSIIPAQDAIHAIYRGRVNVVENWPDAFFHSPSTQIAVPKVVALLQYAPVSSEPKFSRRSILLRDRFRCQYCGGKFESCDLTFDHLVPRSQGGATSWENILTACLTCNGKKADKRANFSGRKGVITENGHLRPLKVPRRPTSVQLMRAGLEFLPNDVKEDFGTFLYWNVPLLP